MVFIEFSSELQRELAHTIDSYVASGGAAFDSEQLSRVTERVCNEAHTLALKPEQMVIALRAFHENRAGADPVAYDLRRAAYDRLLTACIRAYFGKVGEPSAG